MQVERGRGRVQAVAASERVGKAEYRGELKSLGSIERGNGSHSKRGGEHAAKEKTKPGGLLPGHADSRP